MLPYSGGPRIPRLLGVRNYLNNYFAMYKRLTRSRVLRLLGVRNYLNNYFAMYTRPTRFPIHTDRASPTYLGLGII